VSGIRVKGILGYQCGVEATGLRVEGLGFEV
jgi:hypothetical protein